MTDSQGRTSDSNHDSFGWIEVRLTWEPSSGALLSDSMASVASLATTMLSVKRKAGVAPPATIAEESASTDAGMQRLRAGLLSEYATPRACPII